MNCLYISIPSRVDGSRALQQRKSTKMKESIFVCIFVWHPPMCAVMCGGMVSDRDRYVRGCYTWWGWVDRFMLGEDVCYLFIYLLIMIYIYDLYLLLFYFYHYYLLLLLLLLYLLFISQALFESQPFFLTCPPNYFIFVKHRVTTHTIIS
jgi:hypothetical protein